MDKIELGSWLFLRRPQEFPGWISRNGRGPYRVVGKRFNHEYRTEEFCLNTALAHSEEVSWASASALRIEFYTKEFHTAAQEILDEVQEG